MTVSGLDLESPPDGLRIERPLPVLVLLRKDDLTEHELRLVGAEPSRWLLEPRDEERLEEVIVAMRGEAQRILVIDVRVTAASEPVVVEGPASLGREADTLAAGLEVLDCPVQVDLRDESSSVENENDLGAMVLSLGLPAIWRDSGTMAFPLEFRRARHALSRSLRDTTHCFAGRHTAQRGKSAAWFGRHRLDEASKKADRILGEVASRFSFLMSVTPYNLAEAWADYVSSGKEQPPELHYRPVAVDPDACRKRLWEAPIEDVDDPTVEALLRAQRDSLDEQLFMIGHRCTPSFRLGSLRLYGAVEPETLEVARGLIGIANGTAPDGGRSVDAQEFCQLVREELVHYEHDGCEIDDDVDSLIVERGRVVVGRHFRCSMQRAKALIAHEVGTHVVTYLNARHQPLVQLSVGLPGYDELQEGLAVLAEYLVGGLTVDRLRLLAARVIAVCAQIDGAELVEIQRLLEKDCGLGPRLAFSSAVRVCRGGGLSKDAVYLRGLLRLLRYLDGGGAIAPLLVGKLAAPHVSMVEELMERGIVVPPRIVPRHFDTDEGTARMARLRDGASLFDLVEGKAA